MKKMFLSFLVLMVCQLCPAQEEGLSYQTLSSNLKGSVTVSDSVERAVTLQLEKNKYRRSTGFRVRIFFDNGQNARTDASEVAEQFKTQYPDVAVYTQYVNPYFKVTVGNFRTKSDAMRFMEQLTPSYPSAFLVRESLAMSGM